MKYYGWYSAACAKKFGNCIYLDKDGLEIAVTEARDTDSGPAARWNDAVFVGEIFNCIKGNNISFDMDPIDLLQDMQEALALENRCQKQFATTGKCFCFTCPIKTNVN